MMKKIKEIAAEIERIESLIMRRNDDNEKDKFYSIVSEYINKGDQSVYDVVKNFELDKANELFKKVMDYYSYINIEIED